MALPGLATRYNRLGEFFCETYIYAAPVQQALVHFMLGQTPAQNMLLAIPPAVTLAVLCWHPFEKRALGET